MTAWQRFGEELKRRTHARLGWCKHDRWDFMRDCCRGCCYTREAIEEGRFDV